MSFPPALLPRLCSHRSLHRCNSGGGVSLRRSLARSLGLIVFQMFSSDGDDGGELGDVASYFRLIASVLLCGASFPTAAENGFIAALQQDPDRAW